MSTLRALLWTGVIGPLGFIVTFLLAGAVRPGYSAAHNYVSQLATGPGGWVQTVNFFACGALIVAFAVGLRMAIKGRRGSTGVPVLLAVFGLALLVDGIFTTDPANGYPPGAATVVTNRGSIHVLAALIAFGCLGIAALVVARRFPKESQSRLWVVYSMAAAVAVLGYLVAVFTGAVPDAVVGVAQRVAIIVGLTWVAMLAGRTLRQTTDAR